MIMEKIDKALKEKEYSSGLIICLNKIDFEEVKLMNVFWTCKAQMDRYLIWKFDLRKIPVIIVASETCPKDEIFIYN